ncbi:MAG: ATP-binding cassette domain-containing protein, partial [Tissierellia bacterium]|nr:ATP-binding cassette domain-containing protein [Tissierellia bacterium]
MENKSFEKGKVLFEIRNLKKYFPLKKKAFSKKRDYVHANESITLNIYQGETFGLVGESGCGKSTFGRTLLQIYNQTSGTSLYHGTSLEEFTPEYMKKYISDIPKKFGEYESKTKALDEVLSQIENTTDAEKKAELEEDALNKRREIEDNYLNMIRIAGGLLASSNLSEVSNVLMDYYNALKDRSKTNLEIKRLLEKRNVKKEANAINDHNEDPKIKELENKLSEKNKVVEEKRNIVEKMRDDLKMTAGFEEFEALRSSGIDLSKLNNDEMRELRKDLQIIFQDPYSSLDTRMTVGNIIGEGVLGHGIFKSRKEEGYNEYIQKIMDQCGLAPYFIHRYPHQFSGGQRQRIGIARALA